MTDEEEEDTTMHYTLSFCYEFEPHENDEVYFAHSLPFTYTDLNR